MNAETHNYPASVAGETGGPSASVRMRSWDRLWRHRWFVLVVVLPTLLASLYYGLVATDVYVSDSRFTIKSPGQKSVPGSTLASLIQTTGLSAGQEQTQEVLEYLRSRNAVEDLRPAVDLREVFGRRGADILSRFPQPFQSNTEESLYEYYSDMVTSDQDPKTNIARLQVRAFTPKDAQVVNARLLDLSEALVNRLNKRAEGRAIAEAQRRVAQAEGRLRSARLAMGAYRNSQELVDPAKQATGVIELSNTMIGELAALKAQLELMERATPRHPSIPALRGRIAALQGEIAAQNSRVAGGGGGIASKIGEFENRMVEQELATQVLTAANASLEQARAEAQRQQFYLERVVEPNRPDYPVLPNRLIKVLTIAAALMCLYFIGWMFVVGVLEHAPED